MKKIANLAARAKVISDAHLCPWFRCVEAPPRAAAPAPGGGAMTSG